MQHDPRRLLISKSAYPQFIAAIDGVKIKSEPAIASHSGGRWMHPALDVYRGSIGTVKVVRYADDTQPYPIARGSIPAGVYLVLGYESDATRAKIAALPMVQIYTPSRHGPPPASTQPAAAGFIQQSLFE